MVLAMPNLTPEQVKAALKEGIREWLDDKFADFGKWSMAAILASCLALVGYLILLTQGWHKG